MKKISTKIIVLSVINNTIIAIINVGMSIYMNLSMSAPQAVATTTDAAVTTVAALTSGAAVATAAAKTGLMAILPPTPILIGLGLSLVLGAAMAYGLGRYISKPIIKVTELTRKTASFDLREDNSIAALYKYEDESGEMAKALGETRLALRTMAEKVQGISHSLGQSSENLSDFSQSNLESVTQVVTTINEVAQANTSQAQTIVEINETLNDVVHLIDQVTTEALSGAKNAVSSLDNIQKGQETVAHQVQKMEQNMRVTTESNKTIEELNQMIGQVATTISVITSIASQTNLLALNASIESARAGEAGKGFAVVADEIRKLAEDSSNAAKSITEVINRTQEKTKQVMENMNTANKLTKEQQESIVMTQVSFGKIQTSYSQIVEVFNQNASAMTSINKKSKAIAEQTEAMSATAQESASCMQEISATSQVQLTSTETIAEASKELYELASALESETKRFKMNE